MSVDEEIEVIESVISFIESAINDLRMIPYMSYKVDSLLEDLDELQEKLCELEEIQLKEWQIESKELEHEYWQDQL